MTIPIGRITRDNLLNHRLAPHQCTANMFRVLGCVDALNDQMNLGLSWHNVFHLYECIAFPGRITWNLGPTRWGWYLAFPSPIKAWRMIIWSFSGNGMTVFTTQLGQEHQVGTLGSGPSAGILVFWTFPLLAFSYLVSRINHNSFSNVLQIKITSPWRSVWSTFKLLITS